MTQSAIARPTLPKADVLMTAGLVGLMAAMDVAALAIALERPSRWEALLVMPGTVAVLTLAYSLGLRGTMICQNPRGPEAAAVAAAFMGKTLVMMALTLTVFHGGLLGFETGLIDRSIGDGFIRVFVAALGLNIAYMGNAMAKIMTSRLVVAPKPRLQAWGSFVCGLGLVAAAIVAPDGQMTPIVVTLAAIPLAITAGTRLTNKVRRNAG